MRPVWIPEMNTVVEHVVHMVVRCSRCSTIFFDEALPINLDPKEALHDSHYAILEILRQHRSACEAWRI